ncbi:hypothetical protein CRENBAI_004262 [Crenichthys baileyi]|uniref:Uncharacterized protein n=1 Tax=Crenichthys baileyi TaxID=28760 RepID=A0AAV9RZ39_9TELE
MSGASSRSDGSVPPLQCPGGPSGALSAQLSQSADVLCSAPGWRDVLCCTHLTSKLKAATEETDRLSGYSDHSHVETVWLTE